MDVPDTLTLARLDRESQGPWEAEYSYGGEADLHQHYDDCTKNPGHKNFIPVDKFSIEDLPEGYRDSDILEYIRAVSDLTVLVTVTYVSDKRPEKFPGSEKQYLLYESKGQRKLIKGTGYVSSVDVFNDKEGEICKCKDCRKSSAQVTKFAIINIHTVAHVIFDEFEAEKTTCHLSFFKGGILDSYKSGRVPLTDMSCWWRNIERDQCEVRHYTHDLDLIQGLKETQKRINKLSHQIYSKLRLTWNFKRRQPVEDKQPLLFIVSHPHGRSKQVSIGRWTGLQKMSDVYSLFWYNTPTCPGSSGARICLPEWFPHGTSAIESFTFCGGHHGPSNVKKTNFCHANAQYHTELPECVTVEMLNFEGGAWEPNFSRVGEEDLCKDYNCQKNSGHQNFFPIDKFGLDNLPLFYSKDDILEFIKIVSDLTVRVSMWCVSGERPETVPGADIPDTCDSNKVYKLLRVGSGLVTNVSYLKKYQCQDSPPANVEFAHITINTASHLAYNNPEGNPIMCELFFDSGGTPDDCVIALTRCSISLYNINDSCKIFCMTDDMDLADRLQQMTVKYKVCLDLLNKSDYFRLKEDKSLVDLQITEPEPLLQVMVSHPHGCAKQISIHKGGSHDNTGINKSQWPDSWITCPGSSGAPVIVMGPERFYPCLEKAF